MTEFVLAHDEYRKLILPQNLESTALISPPEKLWRIVLHQIISANPHFFFPNILGDIRTSEVGGDGGEEREPEEESVGRDQVLRVRRRRTLVHSFEERSSLDAVQI